MSKFFNKKVVIGVALFICFIAGAVYNTMQVRAERDAGLAQEREQTQDQRQAEFDRFDKMTSEQKRIILLRRHEAEVKRQQYHDERRRAAKRKKDRAKLKSSEQSFKMGAFSFCKDTIMQRVAFKDKAVFGERVNGYVDPVTGKGKVGGTVELMSGFGVMVPKRFVCDVDEDVVTVAGIINNY